MQQNLPWQSTGRPSRATTLRGCTLPCLEPSTAGSAAAGPPPFAGEIQYRAERSGRFRHHPAATTGYHRAFAYIPTRARGCKTGGWQSEVEHRRGAIAVKPACTFWCRSAGYVLNIAHSFSRSAGAPLSFLRITWLFVSAICSAPLAAIPSSTPKS
jgi:hypothetical protein